VLEGFKPDLKLTFSSYKFSIFSSLNSPETFGWQLLCKKGIVPELKLFHIE